MMAREERCPVTAIQADVEAFRKVRQSIYIDWIRIFNEASFLPFCEFLIRTKTGSDLY
jgi:hypothetical protein